jgi:hypothetical protein
VDPYDVLKNESSKNPAEVERIYYAWKGNALETLKKVSNPIPDLEHILRRLYAPTDWICVGAPCVDIKRRKVAKGYLAGTGQLQDYIQTDLSVWANIVPNPMRYEQGFTKKAKRNQSPETSDRCQDNACIVRKYTVMDFDFTLNGSFGELIQRIMEEEGLMPRYVIHEITAAIILEIAQRSPDVPLLMVVDSGGKSLHAWWDIASMPYEKQKEWFYKAVPLGADWRIFDVTCQFVRMPHGTKEITGVRQSVIYWGL